MLADCSPKPAQRTAVRAVTGQVRETSSNGKGSAAAADDHSMQEQARETPKQQFNWCGLAVGGLPSTTPVPAHMLKGHACVCTGSSSGTLLLCWMIWTRACLCMHSCWAWTWPSGGMPTPARGGEDVEQQLETGPGEQACVHGPPNSFLLLAGRFVLQCASKTFLTLHAGRSKTAAPTAWRRCLRASLTPRPGSCSAATTGVSVCCWTLSMEADNLSAAKQHMGPPRHATNQGSCFQTHTHAAVSRAQGHSTARGRVRPCRSCPRASP